MPNFKYLAYNTKGREISGKTFSQDENEAILDLREKGLYVKDIEKDEKSGFRLEKGIGISDIFINLSAMISAGVLVPAAVKSISGETGGNVKKVMEDVYNNVVKGLSLSGAMELRKDFFPQYAASMVRAGEESGKLDTVLTSLAGFLEREKELKDKVRSALIYPAFMVTVSLLMIFFIFVFVFPKVTGIFMDQKIPLPLITRIFMGLSNFLYSYWYLLIIFAGSGIFFRQGILQKKNDVSFRKAFLFPRQVIPEPLYFKVLQGAGPSSLRRGPDNKGARIFKGRLRQQVPCIRDRQDQKRSQRRQETFGPCAFFAADSPPAGDNRREDRRAGGIA